MRYIFILLFLFAAIKVNSQAWGEIYDKKNISRYEPKYVGSLQRLIFKINKDGIEEYSANVLLSTNLPLLWFPVITSGVVADSISRNNNENELFYSKPIKHKIFRDFVFFSPLFELDAKFKNDQFGKRSNISSSRFYLDTFFIDKSKNKADPSMSVGYTLIKEPIDFLQSFYIKKFEVTNEEYREFTNWVKDSMAMELLIEAGFDQFKIPEGENKYRLNWKNREKIWELVEEEAHEALSPMYIPVEERFFRKKEFDTKKLVYNHVKIYPDTTVWMQDFTYSYNDPFSKQYFWHSEYVDYPVVGVNWFQAKAFCQWKEKMIQKDLDKANLSYKISVDLPTEYEREYVLAQYSSDNERVDKSYLAYLHYNLDDTKWELGEEVLWKKTGTYKKNGFSYTHPADISKIKLKKFSSDERALLLADSDHNGISGLKSNVSEWMQESYQENWLPAIKMRYAVYKSVDYKENLKAFSQIDSVKISKRNYDFLKRNIQKLEKYYTSVYPLHIQLEQVLDELIDKDGKLVRGSNWNDKTFERKDIVNAKTFLSPNKAYSTIGFRYVIHVYPKGK